MWQKVIKIILFLSGVLIVMIQTPYSEAISNFSTWIPETVLLHLPKIVKAKVFDQYVLIVAITCIIASVLYSLFKLWQNYKFVSIKDVLKYLDENPIPCNKRYMHDGMSLSNQKLAIVEQKLYTILKFVEEEKIVLYGKNVLGKTIKVTNHKVNWLNSQCWNKDFSSIIMDGKITYINLKFKKAEFFPLVKKVRSDFLQHYS